jgi:hypothetical protein
MNIVILSAVAMMIHPSVISILDLTILWAVRVRLNTYARSHAIVSMMTSDVPIQRLPHGMSQTAVRAIAREKLIIEPLSRELLLRYIASFGKYRLVSEVTGSRASVSPAMIHERYISDHIAKVNPAGVTDVANIFEISACVIPPMRYGEPGILTRVVSPIVMSAVMRRRYLIIIGKL